MALATQFEATANATVQAKVIGIMLDHVHASAARMAAENWYGANGGWSVYRVQEYLLVLQWLIENAQASETAFLHAHAELVMKSAATADWEGWFGNWSNAHCQAPAPLKPLPPPPKGYAVLKEGVFCCDQSPCKDGPSSTNYTSKWRDIWIRHVFCYRTPAPKVLGVQTKTRVESSIPVQKF